MEEKTTLKRYDWRNPRLFELRLWRYFCLETREVVGTVRFRHGIYDAQSRYASKEYLTLEAAQHFIEQECSK